MFFNPVLKNYLWGGRNLLKLGRELPDDEPVAESWEIAAHKDGMSVVLNGTYAGRTLQQLLDLMGEDFIGKNNLWALERGLFPLMVKIIDAEKRLSVQVHPDDEYAKIHEGNEFGKTEMWVVLDAKPGTEIVYGFAQKTSKELFQKAIETSSVEKYLNQIPIKTGDHICVPSGTMHAILDGSLIVEIQQNSNTTYRVYDWGRKDDKGNARQLHVDKAMDVINFDQVKPGLTESTIIKKTNQLTQEVLCSNQYFVTERITCLEEYVYKGICDGSTMEIWGLISGRADIDENPVANIQFFVLPAKMGEFSIHAYPGAVLLRVYTARSNH